MKRQIEYILIVISMAIILMLFVLFMFWWVYPYKTIVVSKQPYPVLTPVVHQGEMMTYEIEYCKYTKEIAEVRKTFVDGIVYSLPESAISIPVGCGAINISIQVPKSLPVGNYYLRVVATSKVNPIRNITNEYTTDKFEVVK